MSQTFKVRLPADSLCTGLLTLHAPTPREHRETLKRRTTLDGLTWEDRIAFVDRLLDGIEDGRFMGEPFTADQPDWKEKVGDQHKNEIFARWFEERPLTRIDEKKSETPSGS